MHLILLSITKYEIYNPVNPCKYSKILPLMVVFQCRARLQAAGGQATAPDEETLPPG